MAAWVRRLLPAFGIVFALLLSTARADPVEGRLALVIGEAAYTNMPPLKGCAVSAQVVANRLRQLGFDVAERIDASNGAVSASLGELARRIGISTAPIVAIYFCGYMLAYDDRMFLLPVTAFLSRPTDILTQGIPAQSVVDLAKRGARVSLTAFDIYDRATGGKPGAANPANPFGLFIQGQTPLPGHLVLAAAESAASETATPFAQSLAAALGNPPIELGRLTDDLRRMPSGFSLYSAGFSDRASPVMLAPPVPTSTSAPSASPPSPAGSVQRQQSPPMPEENEYSIFDRRRIQAALRQLGYYAGDVDGVIGPDTRAAIRRYQHELRAPMTGRLTAEQATRLLSGSSQPPG